MPDQPAFELFGFWRSSASYRVRVALNLKGLTVREQVIDLDAGHQRATDYLDINPHASVPVLIATGHPPMTQSLAILEYLEEAFPEPPLLPSDTAGRARVRAIAAGLGADTHPLIVPRVRRYLTAQGFDDPAWRAWQTEWFTAGLRALESRLAGDDATGRYCHRDTITVADILLMSIVSVMRVFRITVDTIPTIDRIVALCETHDAFAKAAPMKQKGAPPI